jgi:hypothetical protein
MDKKMILILFLQCCLMVATAQVSVNTTGAAPNASSMLDVSSTTKGILVPRMSSAQRAAIATPANGLLVYDNSLNQFYYYNGTAWLALPTSNAAGSGWLLGGNSGTNPATNFIGTTDAQPLKFKIDNTPAGEISSNSNTSLGINTNINSGGAQNTGVGGYSLTNVTGLANTALGYSSLYSNVGGNNNTAVGANALTSNASGYSNVALGHSALYNNGITNNNVAVGDSAGYWNGYGVTVHPIYGLTNGLRNTAVGSKALYKNIGGNDNTAIGNNAMDSVIGGNNNTAIGSNSMGLGANSGINNTAVGVQSMEKINGGWFNTGVGAGALADNLGGGYNTGIGTGTLSGNTTGAYNTALGFQAKTNGTNLVNATAIGTQARVDCDNCMVLGSVNGINGATADANIGIGTNYPVARLDVRGRTNLRGGLLTAGSGVYLTTGGSLRISNSGNSVSTILDGNSIQTEQDFLLIGGTISSPLSINPYGGNVGIGFTNPSTATASLTVNRGSGSGGTAAFKGTTHWSHFNFSTTEDTYIRGGKNGSKVLINDSHNGEVNLAAGGGEVNIASSQMYSPQTGNLNMVPLGIVTIKFTINSSVQLQEAPTLINEAGNLLTSTYTFFGLEGSDDEVFFNANVNAAVAAGYSKLVIIGAPSFSHFSSPYINASLVAMGYSATNGHRISIRISSDDFQNYCYVSGTYVVYGIK